MKNEHEMVGLPEVSNGLSLLRQTVRERATGRGVESAGRGWYSESGLDVEFQEVSSVPVGGRRKARAPVGTRPSRLMKVARSGGRGLCHLRQVT